MASKNIKGITIEIGGNTTKLQDALKGVNSKITGLNSDLKALNQALKLDPKNTELLSQKQEVLARNISASKDKLATLIEAQKQMGNYNSLTDEQKESYNQLSLEIAKSKNALEQMNSELKNSSKHDLSGLEKGLKKVGEVALDVSKKMLEVSAVISTALAGVVGAGVKSYAELEQNLGGVETLFGDSADKVKENASKAFETAGVSANEYMAGVTSFSASLLQSLGNDTSKAADVADMAFRDMSDNANKFGTDMSSIQNAYQGFAKQNYTMLDNLKLGYGGTKTEMERLLKDAEKISGVKYDISNLSDVYNAIHVVQEELGVTGTTSLEASSTISGSVNSMKAAFDNFLNGSGSPSQLSKTIINVLKNISKAIQKLAPDILNGIVSLIQEVLPETIKLIIDTLPQLLDTVSNMIKSLLDMIKNNQEQVSETITTVINQIIEFLTDNLPLIIDLGIQILLALTNGIIESIPKLVEKLPVVINAIIKVVVENIPAILKAGWELLKALIKGIIDLRREQKEQITNLITKLKDWLLEGLSKIKDVGKQLISGLWEGIKEKWNSLKNKVEDLGEGIVKKFKSVFGIASPSKIFKKEIGQYLALGVSDGFEDTMKKETENMTKAIPIDELVNNVNSAMGSLSYGIEHSINPTINPKISLDTNYLLMAQAMKNAMSEMNIELDDREVGKFVTKTITSEVY